MNFARVDQFAIIKSQNLLVNTHDPYQNAIVTSQRVNFSAAWAHYMPRCACASEVYGSVFVCVCV